jgi:hypothetical protein
LIDGQPLETCRGHPLARLSACATDALKFAVSPHLFGLRAASEPARELWTGI